MGDKDHRRLARGSIVLWRCNFSFKRPPDDSDNYDEVGEDPSIWSETTYLVVPMIVVDPTSPHAQSQISYLVASNYTRRLPNRNPGNVGAVTRALL